MYLDSAKNRKERAFLVKVNDFLNNTDYRKFYPRTKTMRWFIENYEMILQSNNIVCKKTIEQYEEYIKKRPKEDFRKTEVLKVNDMHCFYDEKFLEKLNDFVEMPGLDKFNEGAKSKFHDDTGMARWFYTNMYAISLLNNDTSRLIEKQYGEYATEVNKKRINHSKEIAKNNKEFRSKLNEFYEIEDLNKYSDDCTLAFEDGTLIREWLLNNLSRIKNARVWKTMFILKQLEEYSKTKNNSTGENDIKSEKDAVNSFLTEGFLKKLRDFVQTPGLEKFDKRVKTPFYDNTNMAKWFDTNKLVIFSLDDECSEVIKKQYEVYEKEIKRIKREEFNDQFLYNNRIFDARVDNFLKIEDFNKFSSNCNFTFKDGTLVSLWLANNLKRIQNSCNKNAHMFMKQYKKYFEIKGYIKKEKFGFKDRIYEFVDDPRINKFSINFPVFFSDGISMGVWLACNYDKVSSSKLELCTKIIKQKELYDSANACFETSYDDMHHLSAFTSEIDLRKFDSDVKVLFQDGSEMWTWFDKNFDNIFLSSNSVTHDIKLQYNMFLKENNFVLDKSFMDKLSEFYLLFGDCKFNSENGVLFKDNSSASKWFDDHRKQILSLIIPECIGVLIQYNGYLKKINNSYNDEGKKKKYVLANKC